MTAPEINLLTRICTNSASDADFESVSEMFDPLVEFIWDNREALDKFNVLPKRYSYANSGEIFRLELVSNTGWAVNIHKVEGKGKDFNKYRVSITDYPRFN
jgi:hypothetical protein